MIALVWFGVLSQDVWRRHDRFRTFDHDLGFHIQYVWLLARGRSFSTILGLRALAHNVTIGYLLFAPLAWVGVPIGHALNLVQAAALAASVIPLYVLARRRFGPTERWVAVALASAFLLHPVAQNAVYETFHPEAMAVAPLLGAYVAADRSRWRPYWLLLAVALVWKTDVALFVVVLGLLVALRRDRHVGLATAAFGGAWLVFTLGWLIPTMNDGAESRFGVLYSHLGDTPAEVATTAVRHPTRVARHLGDVDIVDYSVNLLAPAGFAPLLAPATLLLGAPQYAVDLLSNEGFTRDIWFGPHYQLLPLAAMSLASIEGLAALRRRRPALLEPAAAVVVASALAGAVTWGALPIGTRYETFHAYEGDPLLPARKQAAAMPDGDDAVSATWNFVAQVAERTHVYTFPNPWIRMSYGTQRSRPADPRQVEWLLLDETTLDERTRDLVDCIERSHDFDEVFAYREIRVLARVVSGTATAHQRCGL